MALPICPACGLRQTLRAPRCARCGAPLDGSPVIPPGGPAPSEPSSDGRPGGAGSAPDAPTTEFTAAGQPTAEFPATGDADDLTLLRGQPGSWDPVPGPTPASASPWGPGTAAKKGDRRGFWQRLRGK